MVGLFFAACRPDANPPTIALSALLIEGEPVSVNVALVDGFELHPAGQAEVTLRNNAGQTFDLSVSSSDPFEWVADGVSIEAGRSYSLTVVYDEQMAMAEAVVPQPIAIAQISSTTITVNPASTGQPIFTVLWEANSEVSRLLVLDEPAEGAQEIPFTGSSGNFANQFRLPVPGQGTTLWDTDFRYYGLHTLSILTIDKAYESLFFYTPAEGGQRLTEGVTNVVNGTGYVAAASRHTIEIEILP